MKVLVTGASGYIGLAVCTQFQKAGIEVKGLIRSEKNADKLHFHQITPILGEIQQYSTYSHLLSEVDVLVHCAADHSPDGIKIEEAFVEHVLAAFQKNLKPRHFIYTAGIWTLGSTEAIMSESSSWAPIDSVKWRSKQMLKVLNSHSKHLKTTVLAPGCVYGGSGGLTGVWFSSGEKGPVEIVGDGSNHWPMVHVKDVAKAYLKVAQKGKEGFYLIVDDSYLTVLNMAAAVAKCFKTPKTIHILTEKESREKFGRMTSGMLLDQRVSNALAKKELEWEPVEKNFIDGVDTYYLEWRAAHIKEK